MPPTKRTSGPRDELEWLFGTCESEMGIKSNFNAMILASKLARPPGPPPPRYDKDGKRRTRRDGTALVSLAHEGVANEDSMIDALDQRHARSRLAATAQNRRVMAAYTRLPAWAQRALEAAYTPRQRAPEVRDVFGDAAGLVALTVTARGIRKFSDDWLAAAVARHDPLVPRLRAEATALLDGAISAYAARRSR